MSTILVVEDNPSNLKLVTGVLSRAGYAVLTAKDGDEGVQSARLHRPDLILMDIHMPGTDGLTATRLLRADPATAAIPVVVVTARAMPGDREQILDSGASDYMAKPIRYKELLEMVERILGSEA